MQLATAITLQTLQLACGRILISLAEDEEVDLPDDEELLELCLEP
jgi:hypothetical protein